MKTKLFALPLVTLGLAFAGHGSAAVLVSHTFDGLATDALNGLAADTFSSAITDAGGSGSWVAGLEFLQDGAIGGGESAYLNLGSYINDAQGTASGKFILSAALEGRALDSWQSFGFNLNNTPATNKQFTENSGMATLIYRSSGELDGFGGSSTSNAVDGDIVSGAQLLTVVLDFTPDGGYNGTDNFGTVTFLQGDFATGVPISASSSDTSYTYKSAQTFGSVMLSGSRGTLEGYIDTLELSQVGVIPEPSAALLLGSAAGLLFFLRRRR